jgi:light-regulated signal transduction histidine kinase (bacteriophytochrome)
MSEDESSVILEWFIGWKHTGLSPLVNINGYAELLLEEAFGDLTDEQRQAVQRIIYAARRAFDHWVNPLDYLRLYQSEKIELEAISLSATVAEALSYLQNQCAWIDCIEIDLADNLPPVAGSHELVTVIINCITDWYHSNAYHRGFIHTITGNPESDTVSVQICTRKKSKNIGHPVYYPGTGIAVAELIVQQYGGQFEVEHSFDESKVHFMLSIWSSEEQ